MSAAAFRARERARRSVFGRAAAGCVAAAIALAVTPHGLAEDATPPAAPVPEGIDALASTPAEDAIADRAITALFAADAESARRAAADLLVAGPAGLRRAAHALGEPRDASCSVDRARLLLLEVVAASDRPEVDRLLAAAGEREPLAEARAVAARGLGAGRTGLAVEALARLARDPMPGVRAAALRSLFAIESPAAVAARATLATDPSPDLATLRLRLHRLRGDGGPDVVARARLAYAFGRSPALRVEAVRLLAAVADPLPAELLEIAIAEFATDDERALAIREHLDAPRGGYSPAAERLAAAEALVALLERGTDPLESAAMVDLAVEWIARPAHLRGQSVDDEARQVLAARLPSAGDAVVEPVVRRLLANRFEDPGHGVRLLLALSPESARAALGRVVLAEPTPPRAILGQASGGLRELRRVGSEAVARFLLQPERPFDIRSDGVAALAAESGAFAIPLLVATLSDRDESVASRAAAALSERPEPAARAALEKTLLEGRWRGFSTVLLEGLTSRPTDAAFDLLDRVLTRGPHAARTAVLDEIKNPKSRLRGPKAIALVRRAMNEPALGVDEFEIASALTAVDGPAGVRFIRERWRTSRSPDVMVRNLCIVREREALDLALEIAASLPDDAGLLQELIKVLSDAPATDPARTDPFWRRILSRGTVAARLQAIEKLGRVAHGPMSALLVPILEDGREFGDERDIARTSALRACRGEPGQPPWALLWKIASDRTECDDELRKEAAEALAAQSAPAARQKALAWLAERVDESSESVERIALLAAHGASPGEASDLLQMFEDELARRYEKTPYFRPAAASKDDAAHKDREAALVAALAETGDGPSLDRLAATLFDPRFATYSTEARRFAAVGRICGGGPVAAAADPRDTEVLLQQADEDVNATPATPVPLEASEIVDALARRAGAAGVLRIARALDDARTSGRLAAFSDLYLVWLATRVASTGPGQDPRPLSSEEESVVASIAACLPRTVPDAGVEELWASDRRAGLAAAHGDWATATAAALAVAKIAARTGLHDLPPTRWLGRAQTPPPSWLALRAFADLFEGAALASAGKAEEARDAFRRGLARAPFEPRVLRISAQSKLAASFDLAGAEADVLSAMEIDRRLGVESSVESDTRLLSHIRTKSAVR